MRKYGAHYKVSGPPVSVKSSYRHVTSHASTITDTSSQTEMES